MKKLEINNLSVSYKSKKTESIAVENLSMSLNNGELLVILGPSGCGKTTLLKAITGTIDYEGDIILSGIDARRMSIKDRRLSYVSQSFFAYSFMSVYNNIALPLKAERVPLDEIEKRVLEISERLGIAHTLSRRPKCLSGGQQQRVAIARALIKKPDIYLFDEPFSNLDPTVRMDLKREIKAIKEEYNASMIFVTHDINDAIYLADRVIVMDSGKIIQDGSIDDIIHRPATPLVRALVSGGMKNE